MQSALLVHDHTHHCRPLSPRETLSVFASIEALPIRFFFYKFQQEERWMQVILFFLPKKKTALERETFFIMRTLQPNIMPIKEEGSLFFLHECSYFTLQTDKKNSRPEYISLGKHQQSSSLFLLDPYAWKQWVEGHFISRKRARLSVHIVSMMAIYFARVAGQVCIIEWRLIDKNNRKDTFQFLMLLRDALAVLPGCTEY